MQLKLVPTSVLSLCLAAGSALAAGPAGWIYTTTNATSGNMVVAYARAANGALTWAGSFPTGGMGTGAELGSQGSLVMSHSMQWLFAVNGGSNDISVLAVTSSGLQLTDTVPSGGTMPVSVTVPRRGVLYVVNAGSDNIAGFKLSSTGMLTPIPGSIQSLSGSGVGPAEISFDPDGDLLVVTEKNTNLITMFPVGSDGVAMPGQSMPSSGMTPYGFSFSVRGQLFVSEAFGGAANGSAVSSYRVGPGDTLLPVSKSMPDYQTAACWIATDAAGHFVYTSNTGSNTLSSYLVEFDGRLALLASQAAQTGAGPIDMTVTSDGGFIYTLAGDGTITGDKVRADGTLVAFASGVSGLPTGVAGLTGW